MRDMINGLLLVSSEQKNFRSAELTSASQCVKKESIKLLEGFIDLLGVRRHSRFQNAPKSP